MRARIRCTILGLATLAVALATSVVGRADPIPLNPPDPPLQDLRLRTQFPLPARVLMFARGITLAERGPEVRIAPARIGTTAYGLRLTGSFN
jgi:hypothetical protein